MLGKRGTSTDVLLIEPDSELASLLVASLDSHDAVVRTATNHEEALESLRAPRYPQLIILDLDLPADRGLDLLRAIKGSTDRRHIPTIVFAADPAAIEHAWDAGANCVIRKHDHPEEFHALFPRLSRFWLAAATLPRKLQARAAPN
ncbi:MAG TPA: response regulator [Bryobacteraceae bacterium]|nr:response regulator [Bryobacteraceae bacterium]